MSNRSVVDGDRKFILFWPGGGKGWHKPATHTTIMKSLPVAKGVRTSMRSWKVKAHDRNPSSDFNAWNYVGWIYEIVLQDNGIGLKLVDADKEFLEKYDAA